jgi:hypothetical protein
VRVRTREHRPPRQHGNDVVALDGDAIADGEIDFLSQDNIDLLTVLKYTTARAGDRDDDRWVCVV